MSLLDEINRTVTVSVEPDMRKKVTRRYDIVDGQATMKDGTKFDANVKLAWGTADAEYPTCLLTHQDVTGQTQNPNEHPNDPPAFLIRVYEEISRNSRTQVGRTEIDFDQYGRKTVVEEFLQFFDGSTIYVDVVGTTPAAFPNSACILKTFESTNDGTLISTKLTFIDSGEMADNQELRFGGKVIVRTLKYLNEIPPTPSGYTLVGPSVEYTDGLQFYSYQFVKANGGGGSGTGGNISQGFTNSQGGDIAFDPAAPNASTGDVICTTSYVSQPTVVINPIVQPAGFVLFALDVSYDAGYTLWTSKSGFGGGSSIEVSVTGQEDGALIYTVSQNDATGTLIPAYPGTGTAYNIKTTHARDNGFWRNSAVWHKLPATDTFPQTTQFEKPGNATFSGGDPQLVLRAPVTLTLLADMEVSYDETKITDVPFSVLAPATFYESYTPTDTGIAVNSTQAMGRYLAGASGISGTNSPYNGILCDVWSATLGSSTPSSFSLDLKVLYVKNEIYLTDVDGTVVYRRSKISYDFTP